MRDKIRDGTDPKGERHPRAKLTQDDVDEIRIMRGFGFTHKELGRMYGVSRSNISQILRGESWI
jgi:hypothetical protein